LLPAFIPAEADGWIAASAQPGPDRVFRAAPSSTDERIRPTAAACRGFVYASSVMGVTGARAETSRAAPALVERVRRVTALPGARGLGVRDGAHAAEGASLADRGVLGRALGGCPRPAPRLRAAGA